MKKARIKTAKKGAKMKFKIALKKIKNCLEIMKNTSLWKQLFVYKIDEEKMREYQRAHRLMDITWKNFY